MYETLTDPPERKEGREGSIWEPRPSPQPRIEVGVHYSEMRIPTDLRISVAPAVAQWKKEVTKALAREYPDYDVTFTDAEHGLRVQASPDLIWKIPYGSPEDPARHVSVGEEARAVVRDAARRLRPYLRFKVTRG